MSSRSTTPSTVASGRAIRPARAPATRHSSAATTNQGPAEFDTEASAGTACPNEVRTPARNAPLSAMVTRTTAGTAAGGSTDVGTAERVPADRVAFMAPSLAGPR
ncbi:hypothetical protein RU06_08995 [Curtobacterium flaccumfaciens]|nr:hypothetical protein RU06_08995 [Curtobacterium flaccumfaciens]